MEIALIGIGGLSVVAALLGPSFFSAFENWRIKHGIKR